MSGNFGGARISTALQMLFWNSPEREDLPATSIGMKIGVVDASGRGFFGKDDLSNADSKTLVLSSSRGTRFSVPLEEIKNLGIFDENDSEAVFSFFKENVPLACRVSFVLDGGTSFVGRFDPNNSYKGLLCAITEEGKPALAPAGSIESFALDRRKEQPRSDFPRRSFEGYFEEARRAWRENVAATNSRERDEWKKRAIHSGNRGVMLGYRLYEAAKTTSSVDALSFFQQKTRSAILEIADRRAEREEYEEALRVLDNPLSNELFGSSDSRRDFKKLTLYKKLGQTKAALKLCDELIRFWRQYPLSDELASLLIEKVDATVAEAKAEYPPDKRKDFLRDRLEPLRKNLDALVYIGNKGADAGLAKCDEALGNESSSSSEVALFDGFSESAIDFDAFSRSIDANADLDFGSDTIDDYLSGRGFAALPSGGDPDQTTRSVRVGQSSWELKPETENWLFQLELGASEPADAGAYETAIKRVEELERDRARYDRFKISKKVDQEREIAARLHRFYGSARKNPDESADLPNETRDCIVARRALVRALRYQGERLFLANRPNDARIFLCQALFYLTRDHIPKVNDLPISKRYTLALLFATYLSSGMSKEERERFMSLEKDSPSEAVDAVGRGLAAEPRESEARGELLRDFHYYSYVFPESFSEKMRSFLTRVSFRELESADINALSEQEDDALSALYAEFRSLRFGESTRPSEFQARFHRAYDGLFNGLNFQADRDVLRVCREVADALAKADGSDFLEARSTLATGGTVERSLRTARERIAKAPSEIGVCALLPLLDDLDKSRRSLWIELSDRAKKLEITFTIADLCETDGWNEDDPNRPRLAVDADQIVDLRLSVKLDSRQIPPVKDAKLRLESDALVGDGRGWVETTLPELRGGVETPVAFPVRLTAEKYEEYLGSERPGRETTLVVKPVLAYFDPVGNQSREYRGGELTIRFGDWDDPILKEDNPFALYAGGASISAEDDNFVGREALLRNIEHNIELGGANEILYGLYRSGKSSVANRVVRMFGGRDPYIIAQESVSLHVEKDGPTSDKIIGRKISKALAWQIRDQVSRRFNDSRFADRFDARFTLKDFDKGFRVFPSVFQFVNDYILKKRYWKSQTAFILILDEFTAVYHAHLKGILSDPELRNILLSLKYLAESDYRPAGLFLIGQASATQLFKKHPNDLGFLSADKLTYFSKDETKQIAVDRILLDGRSRYRGDAFDLLYYYVAGSPLLTQRFCKNAFDYLRSKEKSFLTEIEIEEIARDFTEREDPANQYHPLYTFGDMDDRESELKALLRAFAESSTIALETGDSRAKFERWANATEALDAYVAGGANRTRAEAEQLYKALLERDVLIANREDSRYARIKVGLYTLFLTN